MRLASLGAPCACADLRQPVRAWAGMRSREEADATLHVPGVLTPTTSTGTSSRGLHASLVVSAGRLSRLDKRLSGVLANTCGSRL